MGGGKKIMQYCAMDDCANYQPCPLHELHMGNMIRFGRPDPSSAEYALLISAAIVCIDDSISRTCNSWCHAKGPCDWTKINKNRRAQWFGAFLKPLTRENLQTVLMVLTKINTLLCGFSFSAARWRICAALCEIKFDAFFIIELFPHLHVFTSSYTLVYIMSQYSLLPLEQRARALLLFPFIAQKLRNGNLIRHPVAKKRKNTPVSEFILYWEKASALN